MQYFLKSVGLWDHTLSDTENFKLVPIVFKSKDVKDDAKLEYQAKRIDKILV